MSCPINSPNVIPRALLHSFHGIISKNIHMLIAKSGHMIHSWPNALPRCIHCYNQGGWILHIISLRVSILFQSLICTRFSLPWVSWPTVTEGSIC